MARVLFTASMTAALTPLLLLACNAVLGNEERDIGSDLDATSGTSEAGRNGDEGPLRPSDASTPPADGPTNADAADAADAGPACPGAPGCTRTVFVTSATSNGNIGGLDGANNLCQSLANASGNPATAGKMFGAWISTGNSHAPDRLVHGTAPYVRTDGTTVANEWNDLVDNNGIIQPINLDEKNMPQTGPVWTAINASGTRSEMRCSEWTQPAAGAIKGQQGICTVNDVKWTDNGEHECSDEARLYCFEK